MSKVVCVLYDDPVDGYPRPRSRRSAEDRSLSGRPDPADAARDRLPARRLLGSVTGELACVAISKRQGHSFFVTSSKEGPDSVLERELPDAELVISLPFWPAYPTAERIAKAPKLKLAITAGIGSDHVDLQAAMDHKITVAEVTYCNSISVAEHIVMVTLGDRAQLHPDLSWVVKGGWDIADRVARSHDVEGMHVGTVAAGRIGLAVLRR